MRLHLTIRPLTKQCSITLNYSYYLSSAVYRWIEQSSPTYSHFLHEQGFSPEHVTRRFKHFCFSQLIIPQRDTRSIPGRISILSPVVEWFVSMPVEESLQHFVVGLFEKQQFFIEKEENQFIVEQVETLPEPEWNERMSFRMLSPTTVSVPDVREEKFGAHYLFHDDPRLSDCLQKNIVNKYESLYGKQPDDCSFRCTLDEQFINDMQRKGKKLSKLITIKDGRTDQTQVRGFMCPVTIEGNPELIKLAYESGLGEKGSLGFGMLAWQN